MSLKIGNASLADIEALSGPQPVLCTEDRELYQKTRGHFMACFVPGDILEWHLVNRLVDEAWFIKRYTRHQTVAVERRYQQSLEFQVQRLKSQNARKEALASRLGDKMTQSPPEVAHLLHLEKNVVTCASEIDEILQRTPTELQHNRALEKSIVFQDQLDKLIVSASKRFNETLELLEHYREGLGQRLRLAAEELFKRNNPAQAENPPCQIESPSIASPDGGAIEIKEVDQTDTCAKENK
jgi:hypothetical protein